LERNYVAAMSIYENYLSETVLHEALFAISLYMDMRVSLLKVIVPGNPSPVKPYGTAGTTRGFTSSYASSVAFWLFGTL